MNIQDKTDHLTSRDSKLIRTHRTMDWLCYLFLAFFIYQIPRFNPLPVSLFTIATLCGVVLLVRKAPAYMSAYKGKARVALFVFVAIICYRSGINYWTGIQAGTSPLFDVAFICLLLVVAKFVWHKGENDLDKLIDAYLAILLLSVIWFLLTYFVPLFYSFHTELYNYDEIMLFMRRSSGFSSSSHAFGYHLVPITIILCGAYVSMHDRCQRRIVLGAIIMMFTAVVLCGERSVVVATTVGIFSLFLHRQYRARLANLFVISIVVFALIHIISFEAWQSSVYQQDIFTRISSIELYLESFDRLRLQWLGLKVLFNYPEGIFMAGESFVNSVHRMDCSLFYTWGVGGGIAVHNGFLAPAIYYGWFMLLFILAELFLVVAMSCKLIISRVENKNGKLSWEPMLGAAMIGVIVQSMFHNASFVRYEMSSTVLFVLVLVSYSQLIQRQAT